MAITKQDILAQPAALDTGAAAASNPSAPLEFGSVFQGMAQGSATFQGQQQVGIQREQLEISKDQLDIQEQDLSMRLEKHEYMKEQDLMKTRRMLNAEQAGVAGALAGITGSVGIDRPYVDGYLAETREALNVAAQLPVGEAQKEIYRIQQEFLTDPKITGILKRENLIAQIKEMAKNKEYDNEMLMEKLDILSDPALAANAKADGSISSEKDIEKMMEDIIRDPQYRKFDLMGATAKMGESFTSTQAMTEFQSMGAGYMGQGNYEYSMSPDAMRAQLNEAIEGNARLKREILKSGTVESYVSQMISEHEAKGGKPVPGSDGKLVYIVKEAKNLKENLETKRANEIADENKKESDALTKENKTKTKNGNIIDHSRGTIKYNPNGTSKYAGLTEGIDQAGFFETPTDGIAVYRTSDDPEAGKYANTRERTVKDDEVNYIAVKAQLGELGKYSTMNFNNTVNVQAINDADDYGAHKLNEDILNKPNLRVMSGDQDVTEELKNLAAEYDGNIPAYLTEGKYSSLKVIDTEADGSVVTTDANGQTRIDYKSLNDPSAKFIDKHGVDRTDEARAAGRNYITTMKTKERHDKSMAKIHDELRVAYPENLDEDGDWVSDDGTNMSDDWRLITDDKSYDALSGHDLRKLARKYNKSFDKYRNKLLIGSEEEFISSYDDKYADVFLTDKTKLTDALYNPITRVGKVSLFRSDDDKTGDQDVTALRDQLAREGDKVIDKYKPVDTNGKLLTKEDIKGLELELDGVVFDGFAGRHKTMGRYVLYDKLDKKVSEKTVLLDIDVVNDARYSAAFKNTGSEDYEAEAKLAASYNTDVAKRTDGYRFPGVFQPGELDSKAVVVEAFNDSSTGTTNVKVMYKDAENNTELIKTFINPVDVGDFLADMKAKQGENQFYSFTNSGNSTLDDVISATELMGNPQTIPDDVNSTATGIYQHIWSIRGDEINAIRRQQGLPELTRMEYDADIEAQKSYQTVLTNRYKQNVRGKKGTDGLRALAKANGYNLSDQELIYLDHHEGTTGARYYLKNKGKVYPGHSQKGLDQAMINFKVKLQERSPNSLREMKFTYKADTSTGSGDGAPKGTLSVGMNAVLQDLPEQFNTPGTVITSTTDSLFGSGGTTNHKENSWHEVGEAVDVRGWTPEGRAFGEWVESEAGESFLRARGYRAVWEQKNKRYEDGSNSHIHIEPITKRYKKKEKK